MFDASELLGAGKIDASFRDRFIHCRVGKCCFRLGGTLNEERKGGVAVVLGTRPEIIKMASVLGELGSDAWVIHTQQHYDPELSEVFLREFGLPAPFATLDGVGGLSRGEQIAHIVEQATPILRQSAPAAVAVQGDTNSTLGGAIAAQALGIPVVHIEAGLRSGDRTMPEEINRLLVGVIADLHCAPTTVSVDNLRDSMVPDDRIVLTGNTVVESTQAMLPDTESVSKSLAEFGLLGRDYALATIHRPSNTDDPQQLRTILEDLASLDVDVVLPLHPRTRVCIERFELTDLLAPLFVLPPIGYREFLGVASRAALIISDSGGIQEEATVLKRPVLVVRDNTERPEAVSAGFAQLVRPGSSLRHAAASVLGDDGLLDRLARIPSPYGDGKAGERIAAATRQFMEQ